MRDPLRRVGRGRDARASAPYGEPDTPAEGGGIRPQAKGGRLSMTDVCGFSPALAHAIARHRAAQAAYDAAKAAGEDDDTRGDLCAEEAGALQKLAETPCVSDAEFLEKLKYILVREVRIFGEPCNLEFGSLIFATTTHFDKEYAEALSLYELDMLPYDGSC
jgi:hypothetical protein